MIKFFHPPQIETEEQAHQAQVTNTNLLVVVFGSFLFCAFSGIAREANQIIMTLSGGLIVVAIDLKTLLNTGRIRLVNYLLSLILWISGKMLVKLPPSCWISFINPSWLMSTIGQSPQALA